MDVADFLWKALESYGMVLRKIVELGICQKSVTKYGAVGILSISNGLYDQQV